MSTTFYTETNGLAVELDRIPLVSQAVFRHALLDAVAGGARVVCLCVLPVAKSHRLLVILARDPAGELDLAWTEVGSIYPSLTVDCPQVHLFEREIYEQWDILPQGHPWLKPVRFLRTHVGVTDFFRMEGPEVHEVAVGPVHAGVIEPGHFRFQCHGETVAHLEISLGYQHRGVERAMVSGPVNRRIHLAETLAGDTTLGHATAYSRIVEAFSRTPVSARAQAIRAVGAELERLANHIGDLGALAGDVGFLPTQSYGGRIRGDVLNLTAELCGNRFGRGLVCPGGVAFDLDTARIDRITQGLNHVQPDVISAVELMFNSPSVLARLEGVGVVSQDQAVDIGLVGVAARACGLERDVRRHLPYGLYAMAQMPVSVCTAGDSHARAMVRWLEIQRSLRFIQDQLMSLPAGPVMRMMPMDAGDHLAVSLVEGWRGEICHVALTHAEGSLAAYKVVDPSFHNWLGLALALRDQQISDFPLCNKSFNLSYCGHDL